MMRFGAVPLPILVVFSLGVLAAGCGDAGAEVPAPEEEDLVQPSALGACKKHVYIHIANFSWFEDLQNAGIPLNGCWGYDMFQRFQHGWAHFKDHTPTMVDPGAANNANGPRRWVYNETAFTHKAPTDTQKIDQGRAEFASFWGVQASTAGYEYMMYQGSSGWKKSGNPNIARSFAELYGAGNWWPFWSQWKQNPVGRPMGAIADASNGTETYVVIKGLCEYVDSGTFIGVDAEIPVHKGSPALNNLIYAMNDCTGG